MENNGQKMKNDLDLLEEKRKMAYQKLESYQRRIAMLQQGSKIEKTYRRGSNVKEGDYEHQEVGEGELGPN